MKIFGESTENIKINKNLAKHGFEDLKIGKHGFDKVYDTIYERLGYKKIEKVFSTGYSVIVGLIF